MKKYILYAAAISLGIAGSSCSDDFLSNKKQYGVVDDASMQNETQIGWYIDRLYYDFYYAYKSPGGNFVGQWTDYSNLTEERGGIQNRIDETKELENASECSDYYGKSPTGSIQPNPYTRIRNCNLLINNIINNNWATNASEDYKKTALGQSYFLRAMQYYDLVRTYGGVPISLTVDDPAAENQAIKYPRSKSSECFNQVIEDLDLAASMLPDVWEKNDKGRISRAAALAMKSRVLLTQASPLFNKEWDDAGSQHWENALRAGLEAEQELSAAGYGLYGSTSKDWDNMFIKDHGTEFCSEVIFVKLLSPNTSTAMNNGWENSIRLNYQGGSGGIKAPQGMIDMFPLKDGSRPTVENGYNQLTFFKDRDPRFYRTFAFSGSKWGYKGNDEATIWAYRWRYQVPVLDSDGNPTYDGDGLQIFNEISKYNESNTNGVAFVRKMSDPKGDNVFQYSGTDIIDYRYAELLLNIAECYAAKGDIANCTAYLSRIRDRVGIPSDNNYGLGTLSDKYAALEACLYERRVELAYEGKRWFDLQRWMLYNDDAAEGNNTCAKLRVAPLNGQCRTALTLEYRDYATIKDPIEDIRDGISVDPDSEDFESKILELADLFEERFELKETETPMDSDNSGNQAYIHWRQRYYLWGLHSSPLLANPWLKQTKGWLDESGMHGTFDYQD